MQKVPRKAAEKEERKKETQEFNDKLQKLKDKIEEQQKLIAQKEDEIKELEAKYPKEQPIDSDSKVHEEIKKLNANQNKILKILENNNIK